VCAEVPERHDFSRARNDVQSGVLTAQVKASHAQAAAIVQNQALERSASVANDGRWALLGD